MVPYQKRLMKKNVMGWEEWLFTVFSWFVIWWSGPSLWFIFLCPIRASRDLDLNLWFHLLQKKTYFYFLFINFCWTKLFSCAWSMPVKIVMDNVKVYRKYIHILDKQGFQLSKHYSPSLWTMFLLGKWIVIQIIIIIILVNNWMVNKEWL